MLYNNLLCIVNGNKSKEEFELDKSLVYNLVDSNYRKEGESLIQIIIDLMNQNKSELKRKKKLVQMTKNILLDKEDLEKINKKFE